MNRYPWEEIYAELQQAAAQGQRYASIVCLTCGSSFISPRDAWNHYNSIYGPGFHEMRDMREPARTNA